MARNTHPDTVAAESMIYGLALCAGTGMLEEAAGAALRFLGFRYHTVCYVERDACAASFIVARMEAAAVGQALVWDDLATFDGTPLGGKVHIVTAGLPCQPYSAAGRKRGNADERSHGDGDGPLPHTLRIIAAVRPALVWFENVPEWVTDGHFREFGEELCRMGYDIAPPVFLAAEDVGAPHERERVYILCRLADAERAELFQSSAGRRDRARASVADAGADVGDAERPDARRGDARREDGTRIGRRGLADGGDRVADRRYEHIDIRQWGARSESERGGEQLADGELARPQGQSADGCEAANDGDDGRSGRAAFRTPMFPPGRGNGDNELARYVKRAKSTRAIADRVRGVAGDFRRWAELLARGLDPALMPAAERELSALAHGLDYSDAELLRLGGNGIVPLCASLAFVIASRGILWEENG